ncbi:MAG TPA: hypothetical protein PLM58_07800 [Novosphingobium sp.]|uniref:hypothetical protein n=1 Tax=Novosphingobium sp. 28-62-57 TaxID=1970409 RepID=UPI0025E5D84C|nr:hypothetical protein [Novosphingobium sp. 28-62-57]HQS69517.1 hypothetical protein [Novosphingobium sp.]
MREVVSARTAVMPFSLCGGGSVLEQREHPAAGCWCQRRGQQHHDQPGPSVAPTLPIMPPETRFPYRSAIAYPLNENDMQERFEQKIVADCMQIDVIGRSSMPDLQGFLLI